MWVDDADRSISVFVLSDTGYVASSTFRTHVSPQDVCTDGRLGFVYGIDPTRSDSEGPPRLVHVYHQSGERLRSVGDAYRSDAPIVADCLSESSSLECIENDIFIMQSICLLERYKTLGADTDNGSNSQDERRRKHTRTRILA